MAQRSEMFGRLLKGAINSIAAYEGKTAPAVEDEIGARIGLAGSALQRYKAGNIPPDTRTIDVIASAAVRRAFLGRAWLIRFLQAAQYPHPSTLMAQLEDVLGSPAPVIHHGLPAGTVVLLFTDIAGSSERWEADPRAMEHTLERHDEILQKAIESAGGQVFKTVGDAFCAVFTTVPAALEAAYAAQQSLQGHMWGSLGALAVRMAIHVGAPQLRDKDYFGTPLNRVARLLNTAHGNQVLLSLSAQELVRDHLPAEVSLRDLGEHRLKDLARPERIFQLVAPDLITDFPPLRSLSAYRHNLPIQATPLIGREAVVADIGDHVLGDATRLLTLIGPGGIGKTRLALQIAAELVEAFPDGVVFVSLAEISDPAQVPAAILQALGLAEASDRSVLEQVQRAVQPRRLLLVLDNFEQVIPAAPVVSALLAAAPQLRVLVTSREALRVYGEHLYPVPPLTLPDLQNLPPLERLTQYEAVRLFIERAQAVRPDFVVDSECAPLIAEICARLDGLPLAIELAAARSKLFSPKALLARLDQRLRLLQNGARDLPARQQTLTNTIAWSYDLLDAADQVIFARMGIFAGGCTIEAAESVLADEGDLDAAAYIPREVVLDSLSALLDRSLLRQVEDRDGEPRFTMLESIRAYALERLIASGDHDRLCVRHATHYAELAHEAPPPGARQQWHARIRQEYGNIAAAYQWACVHGSLRIVAELAHTLAEYYRRFAGWREGKALLAQALAHLGSDPPLYARLALDLADLSYARGSFQEALTLGQQAVTILRTAGSNADVAWALTRLGHMAWLHGDVAQAVASSDEAVAIFEAIGDPVSACAPRHTLGNCARDQNNMQTAVMHLAHCAAIYRTHQRPGAYAYVLLSQGELALAQQQSAEAYFSEALTLLQAHADRDGTAWAQRGLGHCALVQGYTHQAVDLLRGCAAEFRALEDTNGMAYTLPLLAEAYFVTDEAVQAAALLHEGMQHQIDHRNLPGIAWCCEIAADHAIAVSEAVHAARLLGMADTLQATAHSRPSPYAEARRRRVIAAASAALGEDEYATAYAQGQTMTLDDAIQIIT